MDAYEVLLKPVEGSPRSLDWLGAWESENLFYVSRVIVTESNGMVVRYHINIAMEEA